MKYQPPGSPWCGPAALSNAMRALGVKRSVGGLVGLCKTTKDGTTATGLISAANSLGFNLSQMSTNNDKLAKSWLLASLNAGHPVILCSDGWEHWICCIGLCGQRVILVDSDNGASNTKENGAHVLSAATVCRRWKASRRVTEDSRYFGLSLSK